MFRAEGRTDRRKDITKLTVEFRSVANVPNNSNNNSELDFELFQVFYMTFSCNNTVLPRFGNSFYNYRHVVIGLVCKYTE